MISSPHCLMMQHSRRNAHDSLQTQAAWSSTSRRRYPLQRLMVRQVSGLDPYRRIGHAYPYPVTEDTSPNRLIYTLNVPPIPSHSPSILSTLALIKRTPYLDASVPLASQLHFVLLSAAPTDPSSASNGDQAPLVTQATPYEGLHSLVHWGVAPWFDSYVSSKKGAILDGPANKKGGEAQMGTYDGCRPPTDTVGIPVAKRKFAELELSLLHLQQNVEIPETHLSIHPAVRKAVEQVSRATLN